MARKQITWSILFCSWFLFLWSIASRHWTNIMCVHLRLEIFCFAAALLTAFNINSDFPVLRGRRTGTWSTLALENTETFCLLLKVPYCHHLTGHRSTSHRLYVYNSRSLGFKTFAVFYLCKIQACSSRIKVPEGLCSVKTTADVPLSKSPRMILLFSFYKWCVQINFYF